MPLGIHYKKLEGKEFAHGKTLLDYCIKLEQDFDEFVGTHKIKLVLKTDASKRETSNKSCYYTTIITIIILKSSPL